MAGTQFTEHAWSNGSAAADHTGSPRPTSQPSIPHSLHGFSEDKPLNLVESPRPTLMRRFRSKQRQRTMLIASLIGLLVIAIGAIGFTLLPQKSSIAAC